MMVMIMMPEMMTNNTPKAVYSWRKSETAAAEGEATPKNLLELVSRRFLLLSLPQLDNELSKLVIQGDSAGL
jgi:hypothetical protein